MEMETSAVPPKPPRLMIEEDALVSQVLEIIGGVTLGALQTLDEVEERDVWLMEEEEGDDSVFYSDEEQAQRDVRERTAGKLGASEGRKHVNSVAAEEEDREDDAGEAETITRGESEVTLQAGPTTQGDKHEEPQHLDEEATVGACGESVQPNMQTQPEQSTSAEKVNLPEEEDEEDAQPHTLPANPEPFEVANEQSATRLRREAEIPEQMSAAKLQISLDRQLQVDRGPEQDSSAHAPVGFHQKPSPGYCSLPLPGKTSLQRPFNHLDSSKYSSVSYRKIRRGNTRQKIEEFEYMMMNL